MSKIYGVYDNHIDDTGLVASFTVEADANLCAEYLNNFKRQYHVYYVEEIELYSTFENYLIDCKSA